MLTLLRPASEFYRGALGPAAVVVRVGVGVAVAFAEEGAMAAVAGFDESDIGIGGDPLAGLGSEPDEGIVLGVDDQSRYGNAVHHIGGRGAGVVVNGAGKPAIEGGDAVVEFAEGGNSLQARGVEIIGKQCGLAAKAPEQLQQKIIFIEPVRGLVQRVGRGCQIHRRADCDHGAELRGPLVAPLPCELQHQIAAHGKSDQDESGDAVIFNDVLRHGGHVARKAGVVERGRGGVHATAIALVDEHDVHASVESIPGDSTHVLRIARAFEAVYYDQSQRSAPVRLPMAQAAQLDCRSDFDQAFFRFR